MNIYSVAERVIRAHMTAKKTGMLDSTFNRYKNLLIDKAAQIQAQPEPVMIAYMTDWLSDAISQSVTPMPQIEMFETQQKQKSLF